MIKSFASVNNNGPVVLQRFDSMTDWYRYSEKRVPQRHGSASFLGTVNPRDAVAFCEKNIGERHMRAAKELVNKIDASYRDRDKDQWTPSPYGAYPVVPDYLAGDPFSMRTKQREENNTAPIRYYIEAVVSSGVKLYELEQRAAGLAALIMRTAEERPVELYAVAALAPGGRGGYLATIPINTHPIDLHSTIAAFATREFCRCMLFHNAFEVLGNSSTGMWLYGDPVGYGKDEREKKFRKALDLEPQDVFMQGGYLTDARLMETDPVKWVHQQIEKQRSLDND